jgi:putative transposase
MMKELRLQYPISRISQIMDVSVSGYYDWVDRPLSKRACENFRYELEIKAAHQRTRQTYGPERLQQDLKEHGVQVGIYRIRRIRKILGIRCKQKRKFKVTTHSDHGLPVAENILNRDFKVNQPNKIWVSDITYIPTEEGWLYLAGHKDLFNNEIVGYAMGERLSKYLVSESLLKALDLKRPAQGLLQHSDQGSQYCAAEYRQILDQKGILASMSRRGNCYDNAPMESFWGILKQELIHHRHYATRREAMNDIREYIEVFYNRQRIQDKLGFLSPIAYARQQSEKFLAA